VAPDAWSELPRCVSLRSTHPTGAVGHSPPYGSAGEPAVDALDDLGDAALGEIEVGGEFFLGGSLSAVGDVDGLVAIGGRVLFAREGAVVGFLGRGGHGKLLQREFRIWDSGFGI
jgi:hypothetical protein